MKSRLLVYILFVTAAVLAVAVLIQLGGAWFPLQGVEVVSPAEQSSGALGRCATTRSILCRVSFFSSLSSCSQHACSGGLRAVGTTAGDREIAAGVLPG